MTLKLPHINRLRSLSDTRFSASSQIEYFSLIDLGMDTIKAAVVRVQANQVEVLGHSLVPSEGRTLTQNRADAAILAALVNKALQEAEDATELTLDCKVVPNHALFVLPDYQLAGKRFTFTERRNQPKEAIRASEINALWEKAVKNVKTELHHLTEADKDWTPQTITQAGIWVDHHLVNDPVGLQGHRLSLSVYGVTCPSRLIQRLEQLAEKLEVDLYRTVAASQSLATVIPAQHALAIDVGASRTHCYLLEHNALCETGYIDYGGWHFTHTLAEAFHCDFDSAEALKLAFTSQALSQPDTKLVQRRLAPIFNQWAKALVDLVVDFKIDHDLPANLFFLGGGSVLPGLRRTLLQGLQTSELQFDRTPAVTYLGERPLSGFLNDPNDFRGLLFTLTLSLAKTI